jgi:hypothetical protein
VPDIELPEKVPEYVTAKEPTVPKVILPPLTVPFSCPVVPRAGSAMVPFRLDPLCVHLTVKVPL